MLAVFNMLPGAPLDGGRVLRAVRWARTGDKYRAMRDAGHAGRVLGWGMVGVGVASDVQRTVRRLHHGHRAVHRLNARAEIMTSYVAEQLDGVKVRDLTWFGIAQAGTDMDADSMIWQRQRLGNAGAVAVVGDDGELDGLVLEDQLWAVPSEHRPMVMLTQLMVPFSSSPRRRSTRIWRPCSPAQPAATGRHGVERRSNCSASCIGQALQERLEQARRRAFPNASTV
jgi:hypothetical protein